MICEINHPFLVNKGSKPRIGVFLEVEADEGHLSLLLGEDIWVDGEVKVTLSYKLVVFGSVTQLFGRRSDFDLS